MRSRLQSRYAEQSSAPVSPTRTTPAQQNGKTCDQLPQTMRTRFSRASPGQGATRIASRAWFNDSCIRCSAGLLRRSDDGGQSREGFGVGGYQGLPAAYAAGRVRGKPFTAHIAESIRIQLRAPWIHAKENVPSSNRRRLPPLCRGNSLPKARRAGDGARLRSPRRPRDLSTKARRAAWRCAAGCPEWRRERHLRHSRTRTPDARTCRPPSGRRKGAGQPLEGQTGLVDTTDVRRPPKPLRQEAIPAGCSSGSGPHHASSSLPRAVRESSHRGKAAPGARSSPAASFEAPRRAVSRGAPATRLSHIGGAAGSAVQAVSVPRRIAQRLPQTTHASGMPVCGHFERVICEANEKAEVGGAAVSLS